MVRTRSVWLFEGPPSALLFMLWRCDRDQKLQRMAKTEMLAVQLSTVMLPPTWLRRSATTAWATASIGSVECCVYTSNASINLEGLEYSGPLLPYLLPSRPIAAWQRLHALLTLQWRCVMAREIRIKLKVDKACFEGCGCRTAELPERILALRPMAELCRPSLPSQLGASGKLEKVTDALLRFRSPKRWRPPPSSSE